jgi:hypothetical protein
MIVMRYIIMVGFSRHLRVVTAFGRARTSLVRRLLPARSRCHRVWHPSVFVVQTLTGINVHFILWRSLRGRLFRSFSSDRGCNPWGGQYEQTARSDAGYT